MEQEQIERFMQFATDHMARLAAGMEGLHHRQDALQTQMETFQTEMTETQSRFREVAARLETIVAIQQTQAGMITNLGLQVGQLAAKVDRLAEMQQHTDGRLNIVISQVDDLIRRLGDRRSPQ